MKWKVITLSLLIFLFMSCSSAVNHQSPLEKSESTISTCHVAALEPLVKGSSGGRSSSSSSKKIDIDDDDVDTGTDDGSTPWWLIALILVIVGIIAVVVIWYLFLRK
ncbi:hypothetical protein FGU46_04680 [Methanobacterium sp. CWC-01]|uniref:hypothetical protein n=1 Tax=Methanobacterium aridiramus TaxID=2584467 RepID=UPI002574FCD5|nr:hypothetical protein [Methanobacterium sp. CWC-01]WJI09435.1 hypothetical protein FGU46_04680 [Methanobacterium sp. CWC-01]